MWQRSDRDARVCFIPTASGDSAGYISRFYSAFEKLPCRPTHLALTDPQGPNPASAVLENDIFYVGGGNTREMLSVWRECSLGQGLKEAWQAGKILCGISAGAICWFEQAISDSAVEGELHPLQCLGFLRGTGCPHYDEPGRRFARDFFFFCVFCAFSRLFHQIAARLPPNAADAFNPVKMHVSTDYRDHLRSSGSICSNSSSMIFSMR